MTAQIRSRSKRNAQSRARRSLEGKARIPFAAVSARSLRATWGVLAKRTAYFLRIPRTTKSAVRFTAKVMRKRRVPVRKSTR